MTAPKRPPFPSLLIANDLAEGDVVFASGDGWTRDPRAAKIADSEAAALELSAFGEAQRQANIIVDCYLVPVDVVAGAPQPKHYREALRLLGPSVRRDLGKQAEFSL